jgi:large subunit ribosomal protein L5
MTKVTKVVINMGLGEAGKDKASLARAMEEMAQVSGQKPKLARAKVSVAEFKLRKGEVSALVATLRGRRMKAFLEKLFKIVVPRLRDFRGLKVKGFDQAGNYNLGIAEQVVFPEVEAAKVGKARGLQVTIVNETDSVAGARELLEDMGARFEKEGANG